MTKTDNVKKGFNPKAVTGESLKKRIDKTVREEEEALHKLFELTEDSKIKQNIHV